jgi:hypothetical protein
MLHIGFIDIVRESTALTQMLSASAWHAENHPEAGTVTSSPASHRGGGGMMAPQEGDNTSDYARYSVAASRSLRKKLQKPEAKASIEVIVAVLAFAAYGVSGRGIYAVPKTLDRFCMPNGF